MEQQLGLWYIVQSGQQRDGKNSPPQTLQSTSIIHSLYSHWLLMHCSCSEQHYIDEVICWTVFKYQKCYIVCKYQWGFFHLCACFQVQSCVGNLWLLHSVRVFSFVFKKPWYLRCWRLEVGSFSKRLIEPILQGQMNSIHLHNYQASCTHTWPCVEAYKGGENLGVCVLRACPG